MTNIWVELHGWKAKLRFSACHFIPNHPKCGKLHGHTYAVSIKIIGTKNGDFIVDFEDLKKVVSDVCSQLDHVVLIATDDDDVDVRIDASDSNGLEVIVGRGSKRYVFPREDVVLLPVKSVSAEDLCSYLTDKICEHLDTRNLSEVNVRLDEGLGQGAGCVKCFL
jgi:6-pyruvoyltetrahydropterin/6-carboxytetrahydropterin synthase